MKLRDLVEQCRGEEYLKIIWDESSQKNSDMVRVDSPILSPYMDYPITKLAAAERDVFRFHINSKQVRA